MNNEGWVDIEERGVQEMSQIEIYAILAAATMQRRISREEQKFYIYSESMAYFNAVFTSGLTKF